jgi:hypothetical protein
MATHRVMKGVIIALVLSMACAGSVAGETYVLPVVVKGVQGLSGSYWDSEIRILLLSRQQDIVVRRAWVALADGGFVDDPATAPSWSFPDLPPQLTARMIVLKGSDLLQGVNATHASVGLDIPGRVAVYLHNVNSQGSQEGALLGSGQLGPGASVPVVGPVTIPWATAGDANFRMSVGFVNPSPTQLTLRVYTSRVWRAFPGPEIVDPRYWLDANPLQPLVVALPPWGWRQVNDIFSKLILCTLPSGCWPDYAGSGYAGPQYMEVEPDDGQAPYFAYASIVYSPLNDPEFVSVILGSVEGAPRSDFRCPPDCSGP